MMDEFNVKLSITEFDMDYSGLAAAKTIYSVDYPGAFIGQCISRSKTEKSVLVFEHS